MKNQQKQKRSGDPTSSPRSESSVTLSNSSVARRVASEILIEGLSNSRSNTRDGRTDTRISNSKRLRWPMRQIAYSKMRKAPMETKIRSGDSTSSPRSESSVTLSQTQKINAREFKAESKQNSYFVYYPLSSRLQSVRKETFKKLDGKVFVISTNKIRVNYPSNYPCDKKKTAAQIRMLLLTEFHTESISSFYESTKTMLSQISNVIELISNTCEVVQTASKIISKSTLIRACSILTRFMSLVNKEKFELVPTLCLIADAVALKEDVEEKFKAEAVEDVLLSNVINMLPASLKTFALAFLTISKREALLSPAIIQTLTDILGSFINFLKTLPMFVTFGGMFSCLENIFTHFSSYGLISQCNNIVLKYRKNPNILGNAEFWDEIEDCYGKINEIHCGAAGIAAWDLSKMHPAMRSRIDAFLSLRKLKEQLRNSSRIEPSCFIFDGPPGTLKSVTLTKLLPLLGKTVYVHHVKTTMDGKDFYDMYDNQEIFYMDDVGQQGKSQWRNLINWVSCVPLPLDCATANLKNTKLFNSEIILLTTNQFMKLHGFTAQDGVSDPRALFRRAFVFDWTGTEISNRDGDIQLKGVVYIKKYNVSTNTWEIFNLQGLPGKHEIQDEDQFLAWLCSWILSVNHWKKNCKDNNKMSPERTTRIKDLIRQVDFRTESLETLEEDLETEEVSEDKAEENFEDAQETVPMPTHHREGNRVVVDVPVTLLEYEAMINADFIDFHTLHENQLLTYRYSALSKEIAKEFVKQNEEEWSILKHLRTLVVVIKDGLQEMFGFFVRAILNIPANLRPAIITISIYISLIIGLWAFARVTEDFTVQSSSTNSAEWENIRQLFDSATSSQISSLERNHVKEINVDGSMITCGFCFDKYIIIPSHSLQTDNKFVYVTVRDMRLNTNLLESTPCEIIEVDNKSDLAILKIDKHHPLTFKDIDFSKGERISTHLVTPLGSIKTQTIASRHNLGDIPYSMEGNKTFSNVIPREDQELYTIHFVGLCGSVIANKYGAPIGMHVAGSDSKNLGVSILWQDSINNKLNKLPRSNPNSIKLHEKQEPQTSCARVDSLGYAAVPEHSSINPSPLHGVYPVDRFPADLTKYGFKTVDTIFKKSTQRVVDPPIEELEFGQQVLDALLPEFSDITEEQVVKGYPGIAGLNKKSSNGFGCLPDKTDYIDFDRGSYLDFFREELNSLEQSVKEDSPERWKRLVWFETLKDELRNEEKEGEPRSFRVSTIHQQIWTKTLTADLVEKTLQNRKNNQIMIGCNPIKVWPEMAQQLSTGNIFAGDIGKWDGAMLPTVQNKLNEVICKKYKGKHKEMLYCILSNLKNSIVLVKGKMYVMTHSMPSGSFLTAFYNSLVNRFYTAMWYRRCTGTQASVGLFSKQVLDYVYGDDKVVGVVKERPDLNAITMLQFFESIGMKFTDANKQPVDQPYQELSEISFLKRDFSYHDILKKIVCPLSLRTLFNTISWVDSKKDLDIVMEGKIDSIYRELYLHPNRETLMLEFELLVESVYGSRKWLSRYALKDLYERHENEYLIDSSKFYIYS